MEDKTRGSGGHGEAYEWGEELDLTSVSAGELGERLKGLAEEERAVSYRRRLLQDGGAV